MEEVIEEVTEEPGADPFSTMDPEMAAHPQMVFKALRDECPVMAIEGTGVLLTRKSEVDEALRHPEIFSSNMDAVDLKNARPLIPLQIDPPEHKKYRKLLDPLFAPRRMALLDESVTQIVNNLIDGFIDRQEVDFAKEFSVPFPSEVFLTLLGLPLAELPGFFDHEGRDHPSQLRGRGALREPGGQRVPAKGGGLGVRVLQRGARRTRSEKGGRPALALPRRRGRRGQAHPQ